MNDGIKMKKVFNLLSTMKEAGASDLFVTVGFPPAFKINGSMTPMPGEEALTQGTSEEIVLSTMTDLQKKEFLETNELNYAISFPHVGRFRVNAFKQRQSIGMVILIINTTIPLIEELKVPEKLKEIIMEKRGLIIVVGATGSGKSTTLAAMLGHRNRSSAGHIITIEDPIEFVHHHEKSVVTQREVGVDTLSWEAALKNTLRQAPDVILIGEIRDRQTMEHALEFAETGHLCLATLHANNANQALDRVVNFFPEDAHKKLLMDLSLNLKGIVSQRLIPTVSGGRVPAVEILLNSARISDLILKGDIPTIKDMMKVSRLEGMQTFDQALFDLYENGFISIDAALRNADSMNDLQLDIKLNSKREKPLSKTTSILQIID
jgi:twitching motility protein PilU